MSSEAMFSSSKCALVNWVCTGDGSILSMHPCTQAQTTWLTHSHARVHGQAGVRESEAVSRHEEHRGQPVCHENYGQDGPEEETSRCPRSTLLALPALLALLAPRDACALCRLGAGGCCTGGCSRPRRILAARSYARCSSAAMHASRPARLWPHASGRDACMAAGRKRRGEERHEHMCRREETRTDQETRTDVGED